MIANGSLEWMWNEAIVVYFKVIYPVYAYRDEGEKLENSEREFKLRAGV
jgi:hypothetical protein